MSAADWLLLLLVLGLIVLALRTAFRRGGGCGCGGSCGACGKCDAHCPERQK